MTPRELLLEFSRLGVRLEIRGDRLAYHPKSAVPTELTEALRRHKTEVRALLQTASQQRLDGAELRTVWHAAVDRLAGDPDWPPDSIEALRSASLRRIDDTVPVPANPAGPDENETSEELVEINWPALCSKCGSLEAWETIGGEWRCRHCDPPEASRRLRALADRIRRRMSSSQQERRSIDLRCHRRSDNQR